MALKTDQKGQLVTAPAASIKSDLATLTTRYLPEIKRALPSHLSAERMQRIFLTALNANPQLQACTPISWLASMLHLAQLGLEPNTPLGHAALVPIWNSQKKVTECNPWLMFQGMIELAMRTGVVATILPQVVKDGDFFDWEEGLEPILKHRPADDDAREDRKTTHAYVVVRFKDGSRASRVLTRAQIERARKASRSGDTGPWANHYDEMAMKTTIRRLFKYLPKSADLARAIAMEEIVEATGELPVNLVEQMQVPSTQMAMERDGLFAAEPMVQERPEDVT